MKVVARLFACDAAGNLTRRVRIDHFHFQQSPPTPDTWVLWAVRLLQDHELGVVILSQGNQVSHLKVKHGQS